MASTSYDIAVIGGGVGGYVAALRAAQLGATTVLVEKDRQLGGTCLNWGCIPTKALLTSAEIYSLARRGEDFGLRFKALDFDMGLAQARKAKVVAELTSGVASLLKAASVTVVNGAATLEGQGIIKVGDSKIKAGDIVLATGSVPARIPIKGVEHTLDSTAILQVEGVPKRLVVIGGGVVGMEFASLFSELGSQVTVLEMLPEILPMIETDISRVFRRHFEKLGGVIHTEAKVEAVVKKGKSLGVQFSIGGEAATAEGDIVLMAAGRSPFTEGLGLEKAGVELDGRRIKVDTGLRTSAEHVWAIGDVIGGIMLAHVASYEGVCAVESIAGGDGIREPDYHAVPNCVYTEPEMANVGLGEKEARDRGLDVKVGRFPLIASGRAKTLGQTEGVVKVIADAADGRVLGVQMIGPRVTDVIAEATFAIQHNHTLADLDLTIHAHPTMAESFLQAALAADGRAIEIPNRKARAEPATIPAAPAPSATASVAARIENEEESQVARKVVDEPRSEAPKSTPIHVDGRLQMKKENRTELLRLHRMMYLIRRFEERTQEMYTRAKIGGYCHLNLGEEATVVGGIVPLKPGDYIYTSYREHGHAIARGVDPKAVMAELFGKETGTSKGRGGSMHMYDAPLRFMGGYGIVGGHLPLAVGAAFKVKYRKEKDVVFCMFGDGATNIGAFHESLNFAKVFELPVVWFCVNNKWGMGTAVENASAVPDIVTKACGYDMEGIQVDGMNLLEVLNRTSEVIEKTRADSKPRFIEALTYRFKGHSVVDPDKYRDEKEKAKWRKSDPLTFFEHELVTSKVASEADFKKVREEIEVEVEDIIKFADESPNPDVDELYRYVYNAEWEVPSVKRAVAK